MTRSETLEILARQGVDIPARFHRYGAIPEAQLFGLILVQVGIIPCGNFAKCKTWITAKSECQRDHKIGLRQVLPEQRAEHDKPWNQWYLCLGCHSQKTNLGGVGLAIGSDAARNAKLRRRDKKLEGVPCRVKPKIPSKPLPRTSSPWPAGRKLKSRPFSPQKR